MGRTRKDGRANGTIPSCVLAALMASCAAQAGATTLCGRTFATGVDLVAGLNDGGARIVHDDRSSLTMEDPATATTWIFVKPGQTASGVYCKRAPASPKGRPAIEALCSGRQEACDTLANAASGAPSP